MTRCAKQHSLRFAGTMVLLAILLSACSDEQITDTTSATPVTSGTQLRGTDEADPIETEPGSSAPNESEQDTMVNGYDPEQVWNLCVAEGKKVFSSIYISNDPYSSDAVTAPDPETGIAEGVFLDIGWKLSYKGQPVDSRWHCVVSGPTSDPVIASITMPDK